MLFLVIGRIWYHVLGEELMISYLKRHGGLCRSTTLRQEFLTEARPHTRRLSPNNTNSTIEPVLNRLEKKGAVTVTEYTVSLVNPHQLSTFEEIMKHH